MLKNWEENPTYQCLKKCMDWRIAQPIEHLFGDVRRINIKLIKWLKKQLITTLQKNIKSINAPNKIIYVITSYIKYWRPWTRRRIRRLKAKKVIKIFKAMKLVGKGIDDPKFSFSDFNNTPRILSTYFFHSSSLNKRHTANHMSK
jgi:hypothetical protein